MPTELEILKDLQARIIRLESKVNDVMDSKSAASFLNMSLSAFNKITRPANMLIPASVFGGKKKLFLKKDLIEFVEKNKAKNLN